jgi:hypothetical protein
MPVYTVHAPVSNNADIRATDRFAFVRDGFHVWAAILGVVWLAWHRLWLALIGWIVLMTVLDFGMVRLGIVVADDEEAAERRFFDRWTAKQRALSNDQPAVDRGGPPPTRDIPGQAFSRPPPVPPSDIIGLFPEPGASR